MVDSNHTFGRFRIVVFGAMCLFAVMAIALGGLLEDFSSTYLCPFPFAGLAIATGVFTLVSLPFMVTFNPLTCAPMLCIEILWTWFLWIMWVAVGGSATTHIAGCSNYAGPYIMLPAGLITAACRETSALAAFGILSSIFLTFYNITLAILPCIRGCPGAQTRVNNTQAIYDHQVFPTHATQYPPVDTPIPLVQQQAAGSDIQPFASPHSQPQDAVSPLNGVTETDFRATGVDSTPVTHDSQVSPTYAIQYPPVGAPVPIVQQQTAGSDMQPVASPNSQPQNADSAFTHSSPQAQPGSDPHAQF